MSLRQRGLASSLAFLATLVFGAPVLAQDAQPAADAQQAQADQPERKGVEEILVTARKREESIQDIPIAVSAFSGDDLATSNIDDVADVQFNVPNLQFTKTNFMGAGNISLRGVGNLSIAATGEAGTGIHINEAPMAAARIFETDFFDVERVEVLRGPQGTLFGRSAPGGAVNVYTKKPVLEAWGGFIEGEYGDYNHGKIKAAVNIPLGEHFAARFGGYYWSRDGVTENVATDHDVDDRSLYMLRGSISGEWDDVDFNLMGSYFAEDDERMRINKQACTTDARAWPFSIGCQGGDVKMKGDPINSSAILVYSTGIIIDTMNKLGPVHNFLLTQPGGSPYVALGFPNRPVTQTPRYMTGSGRCVRAVRDRHVCARVPRPRRDRRRELRAGQLRDSDALLPGRREPEQPAQGQHAARSQVLHRRGDGDPGGELQRQRERQGHVGHRLPQLEEQQPHRLLLVRSDRAVRRRAALLRLHRQQPPRLGLGIAQGQLQLGVRVRPVVGEGGLVLPGAARVHEL